jgi:aromatic-L-amino-acid decarboxylase
VRSVNATGRTYITHTVLRESVAMRVAVGNVLTTERHLADVFSLIKKELQSEREFSRYSGCKPHSEFDVTKEEE